MFICILQILVRYWMCLFANCFCIPLTFSPVNMHLYVLITTFLRYQPNLDYPK